MALDPKSSYCEAAEIQAVANHQCCKIQYKSHLQVAATQGTETLKN